MVELMVIADDLTGALDSGVKFAQLGAMTQIFPCAECSFDGIKKTTEVVIVNTESRHLSAKSAYERVYDLARQALDYGVIHFYKKTDSALRGHIGAELSALHDALRETVCFIPALPQENRFTEKGIHYINGAPVTESVFAKDPFNPVLHSEVARIIKEESSLLVKSVERQDYRRLPANADILVFDACSDQDLESISLILKNQDLCGATAGCAGFAAWLARCLQLKKGIPCQLQKMKRLHVLCGSINEISRRQLDYAQSHGFERITLSPEQRLAYGYYETEAGKHFLKELEKKCLSSSCFILDVASENPVEEAAAYADRNGIDPAEIPWRIAERLGETAQRMLQWDEEAALLIIGGDTLSALIKRYDAPVITPICEASPGTVFMKFEEGGSCRQLLSKSGGFGEAGLLIQIADFVIS